jgi:hypothetical protein
MGLQDVQAPSILDNRHLKVASLSALRTGRFCPPPPPKKFYGTHSRYRPNRSQGGRKDEVNKRSYEERR